MIYCYSVKITSIHSSNGSQLCLYRFILSGDLLYFAPEWFLQHTTDGLWCLCLEAAVPPWVGYNEEETIQQQILALSAVRKYPE